MNTIYLNSSNANNINNGFNITAGNISNTYTFFIVMKIQNYSGPYNGGFIIAPYPNTTWNHCYGDYLQNGKNFVVYNGGLRTPVAISDTLPTQWFIAEVSSAPNDATSFYRVGQNQHTHIGSSSIFSGISLGGLGGHNCDCHVAEFRYYNRRLDTTDHASELSALKTKWGI